MINASGFHCILSRDFEFYSTRVSVYLLTCQLLLRSLHFCTMYFLIFFFSFCYSSGAYPNVGNHSGDLDFVDCCFEDCFLMLEKYFEDAVPQIIANLPFRHLGVCHQFLMTGSSLVTFSQISARRRGVVYARGYQCLPNYIYWIIGPSTKQLTIKILHESSRQQAGFV